MAGTSRRRYRWLPVAALAAASVAFATSCASLAGSLFAPPRFDLAEGREAQLRLIPPTAERPLGGAALTIWTRVSNPNGFGLTITRLDGDLFLQGERAADVTLPLGLPLPAIQDTVIPLEIGVGFAELPGLADIGVRALTGQPITYRLDGTIGVNAGPLGTPSFGPTTWLAGEAAVRR